MDLLSLSLSVILGMGSVTLLGSAAAIAAQHPPTAQQHSTWRSPVPYLFGGLAAMLGLIAFALLILACSYRKLSGYVEQEESRGGVGSGGDTVIGEGKAEDGDAGSVKWAPTEQKIVVIMAGNENPSFLATAVSSRASYFGDCSGREKVGAVEKVEDWTKKMIGNKDDGESEAVQVGH